MRPNQQCETLCPHSAVGRVHVEQLEGVLDSGGGREHRPAGAKNVGQTMSLTHL